MSAEPRRGRNLRNDPMHFSVGAVIRIGGKYLLIDRDMEPLGFAGLAGHVNFWESPEETLVRKVTEESGLRIKKFSLILQEEVPWNRCRAGISSHYWYLYQCEVEGEIRNNPEASKSIGLYAENEIGTLVLEPVWKYWFEKLGVIAKQDGAA